MSASQVNAQIAELNQVFAGGESGAAADSGFRFTLAGTYSYTNITWFRGSKQDQMRSQTRRGGANALSMWTLNLDGLGIATFPWEYAARPSLDGTRVRYTAPCPAAARRTTTWASRPPTRPGTGWGSTTRSRAGAPHRATT